MNEARWTIWNGVPLEGQVYFDSETEPFGDERPWEPPRLAMLGAASGGPAAIVRPEDVGKFVLVHSGRVWVGYNCAAFDYHVVLRHLRALGDAEAEEAWWRIADCNRLRDLCIRDMLIMLAYQGGAAVPKSLPEAVALYTSEPPPDKESPYRLRYGETVGADWDALDPGFFEYLAGDVAPLPELDRVTWQLAFDVMARHSDKIDKQVVEQFGLLSEHAQVKGAIALKQIEIDGIGLDRKRLDVGRAALRAKIGKSVEMLLKVPEYSSFFKTDGEGRVLFTPKGSPKVKDQDLRDLLELVRREAAMLGEVIPEPPLTKTGKVSVSSKFWDIHRYKHPVIDIWLGIKEDAKILSFYVGASDRMFPEYGLLARSGRTSCSKPNLQQVPREGGVRECHIPVEGNLFVQADYSAIEMVCLAAICEHRYKFSALADALREGKDPHCNTAALLLGVSAEEFEAMKSQDEAAYRLARQKAKAINFGVPGGLGAKMLLHHARSGYGVELTEEEALDLKNRFKDEIYPEIGAYLEQDVLGALAANLGVPKERATAVIDAHFDWGNREVAACTVRRIAKGETVASSSGEPYSEDTVESAWAFLAEVCAESELLPDVRSRNAGESLAGALFNESAVTLTGRVRGNSAYTVARNNPFQGLCADGAKLALFGLVRAGYRVAAFIHDEVLVEVPIDADHRAEAERISAIMREGMDAATGGRVPSKVDYALTDRWRKNAKKLEGPNGELLVWREGDHAMPGPNSDVQEGEPETGTQAEEEPA